MKKLSFLMSICIVLTACGSADAVPNQNGDEVEKQKLHQKEEMATVIDWVDFIQFEGRHYVSADSAVIPEKSGIGEKAGAVEFKVADNIDDPYYKIKNGDAAFWKKGTALFRIKGMPDFLAVEDKSEVNGYRLYLAQQNEEEFPHHFKDVDLDSVKLIEIYTAHNEPELLNRLEGGELEAFKALLLQGYEPGVRNAGRSDPKIYQMILYTDDPFAHAFHIYNEGGQWLWYPWDEQFLPDGIGAFVEPAT
jgi:hypothetical protein